MTNRASKAYCPQKFSLWSKNATHSKMVMETNKTSLNYRSTKNLKQPNQSHSTKKSQYSLEDRQELKDAADQDFHFSKLLVHSVSEPVVHERIVFFNFVQTKNKYFLTQYYDCL